MTGRSKALFSLLVLAALVWGVRAYRGGEAASPLPAYAVATIERGEAIVWSPGRDGLQPLKVSTGLVGDEATEVRGEKIEEGMEIAVPETRKERSPQSRHRGWRLF